MTIGVRSLGFLVALAGIMPLGAQNPPAVQLTLVATELAEGDALRVSVKAEGLAGQRVVLFEGATLVAGGALNLHGEAELVVRNLAPGGHRIMARLPQRMDLGSEVAAVQVAGEALPPASATDFWMAASGEQGRRHVQVVEGRLVVNQQRLDIDGVLAAAAVDADLDGRMDLLVATREELLLLAGRLDGTYDAAVKLARWPENVAAIANLLPGDWNGDGRWDVLLGTDTGVELWVAGGESGLLERKFRETGYREPVAADVNGDGVPDVLVEKIVAGGQREPWVWIGTGGGSFVPMKRQAPEARAADDLLVSVKGPVETAASVAGGVPQRSAGTWRGGVIAGGYAHSLRLRSDGTVWAWGNNANGQLGDGSTTERHTPVPASGLAGVVAIAAGQLHSLALKSDGTVWAWGYNYYGQLGDGSTTDRWGPVPVSGLAGVVAIAAGDWHSLALKSDGTVWAWGYNVAGELGDGSTTQRTAPVPVSGLTGMVAIGGGLYHSLALKSDGTVWAWGWNYFGQLGDGTTTQRLTPVPVSGLAGVVGAVFAHEGAPRPCRPGERVPSPALLLALVSGKTSGAYRARIVRPCQ